MSETLYIGVKAIARRLGVSQSAVRRWIRHYGLPAFTEPYSNGIRFCLESSLSAWLAEFERQCAAHENPVNSQMRFKPPSNAVKSPPFPKPAENRVYNSGGGTDHAET